VPPFEAAAPGPGPHGARWILTRSPQRLESLRSDPDVAEHEAPTPCLVSLGRDRAGVIMVNLERVGSLRIGGADADRLAQAVAVELATAAWAEQIDVVVVGFGDVGTGLERVRACASVHEARGIVTRRIWERHALFGSADPAPRGGDPWRDELEPWDLCVVVCSANITREDGEALTRLIEAAGDGSSGVAVVCAAWGSTASTARWRIHAEGGCVEIETGPGGDPWPTLQSPRIPSDFVHAVSSLAAVASNTAGVDPSEGPYEELALATPEGSPDNGVEGGGAPRAVHEIDVGVLGTVEIHGAARPFTRAWTVELVVYLVLHPGGVSNDQWATALWPDRPMAPASLHSTASAARRALGVAASGEDHLPRARGRLCLGPGVRSDWDRFVDLSRSQEADDWAAALALIRGRPFDGLRSPDWVVLEGVQATVEAVVVDVACRFADHCLGSKDPRRAEWAARQGLRVSPYDERLFRVLLRTAEVAGNPAGVEAVMAELLHLVADDVEPYDAVHPETLALYRELSRRAPVAKGR